MTIGDLARETGVKVVTIRYYEQAGLLPDPPRTEGNYRTYTTGHVRRLQFIRRLRDLGFTLDQVRELLQLASDSKQACDQVDRITHEHLVTVQQKIRDLQKLASELRRLSQGCKGGGKIAECRIIEALSPDRSVQ
jgi:Cu(I)-responsive transcriptional regulator